MLVLESIILTLVLCLAVKFYTYFKEYVRYRRLMGKLPTLEGKQFLIGHANQILCPDDVFFKRLRSWNVKGYPVYTLYAGFMVIANLLGPNEIEAVLSPMKHLTKALLYGFVDIWLREGLLTSTGNKWQSRRKILTPAFHFSILQQFISIFNRETEVIVKRIESDCEGNPINVTQFISDLTLHTINETSMGTKLDTKTKEGLKYKESIYELGGILYKRCVRPWLYFNSIYYNLTSYGRTEKQLVNVLHNFTDNVIKRKKKNFTMFPVPSETEGENFYYRKKRFAMLDLLLNAQLKDGSIDDQGIRDEVNTFMFEGHDTTAMSLDFTLMLLACHKDIQNEIYQEIIQILGSDSSKEPTYNNLQEMCFMERCIKESLRLYPSVAFIGRILSEDVVTSSGTIPRDAQVYIHIYDLHRNTSLWPDPEKFDPSRFLPENCLGRHPFSYIPFSAGPRNCIGQRFAILEIKSVLCGILRKFILEPVDTPDTIVLVQDLVLRPKNGVKVKFVLRKQ